MASTLPILRTAMLKTRAGMGDTRLMTLGDSTTNGNGDSTDSTIPTLNGYPRRLAENLNASMAPAQVGLAIPRKADTIIADNRWVRGTGWNETSGFGIASQCAYTATNPAGALVFTAGDIADQYTVYYLRYSGGGTLTATATGGSAGVQSTNGADGVLSITVTAATASRLNTVSITCTGQCFIVGIAPKLSTKSQILVDIVGASGATTGDFTGTGAFQSLAVIAARAPHCVFISLTLNDIFGGVASATSIANLTTLILAIQAMNADVVLMSTPEPSSNQATVTAMTASIAALAATYNCGYIDIHAVLGTWSTDRWTDFAHPNDAGYLLWAEAVADYLVGTTATTAIAANAATAATQATAGAASAATAATQATTAATQSTAAATSAATAATQATSAATSGTTLLSRLSAARALYLDNLNTTGIVASQADINALNQSASCRVILLTLADFERPESGSTVYTIDARTYTNDGVPANATVGPTLTATGQTSGSLAAKLSAATNPATGLYRWTYTVSSTDTTEPIRFDFAGTVDGDALTMSVMSQVLDLVGATWTTSDRAMLTAAYNKLPSKAFLTGTTYSDGDLQIEEATGYTAPDNAGIAAAASSASTAASSATQGLADTVANGIVLNTINSTMATASALTSAQTALATAIGTRASQASVDTLIAGADVGNGDIAVDHNYGGTDELQFTLADGTTPVDDALVTALFEGTINGQTRTGSDGRWISPLLLDAGTYTIVFSKPGLVTKAVDVEVA